MDVDVLDLDRLLGGHCDIRRAAISALSSRLHTGRCILVAYISTKSI